MNTVFMNIVFMNMNAIMNSNFLSYELNTFYEIYHISKETKRHLKR